MPEQQRGKVEDFSVHFEDESYVVSGEGLRLFLQRLDLDNQETLEYLQRLFDKIGLYAKLRELGVEEGAVVQVEGIEFEYQE